jgi:hypothetical protein
VAVTMMTMMNQRLQARGPQGVAQQPPHTTRTCTPGTFQRPKHLQRHPLLLEFESINLSTRCIQHR